MKQRAREKDKIGRKPQRMSPMLPQEEKCCDQRCRNGDDLPSIEILSAYHILALLNLNALAMTLTELAAIAAAAIIGESKSPNTG